MSNSLVAEYRRRVPNDPRSDDEITLLLGQQNEVHGRYSRIRDFVADYERIKLLRDISTPPMAAELGRGFSRGVATLKSSAVGTGALLADVVGAEKLRDALARKYLEIEQESAEENAPGVGRVEDVEDLESGARFVLGKAGELIPQIGEAIVAGAAGAIGGSAVAPGPGTAGGLATGLLGRQAARSILKKGVSKIVREKAARELVEDQLKRVASRRMTAEALNPAVEQMLASEARALAARYGQAGAQLLNFYGQGAGTIYGTLTNTEGVANEDARTAALLGGVGSAIANAPLPIMVAQRFFPGISREAADTYVKRLLADAAKEIPIGAGSEFADELIQIAAEKYADPKKRNTPLSDEDLSRLLNAAVVGGMAGGLVVPASAIPGGRSQTFDPALEQHFANVPPERRKQIAQLKARMDTENPSPEDIVAQRTLSAEEQAFYAVAEPEPEPSSPEEPGGVSPTPAAVTPQAGAEATAPASEEAEPELEPKAEQPTIVLLPEDNTGLANAAKKKLNVPQDTASSIMGAYHTLTADIEHEPATGVLVRLLDTKKIKANSLQDLQRAISKATDGAVQRPEQLTAANLKHPIETVAGGQEYELPIHARVIEASWHKDVPKGKVGVWSQLNDAPRNVQRVEPEPSSPEEPGGVSPTPAAVTPQAGAEATAPASEEAEPELEPKAEQPTPASETLQAARAAAVAAITSEPDPLVAAAKARVEAAAAETNPTPTPEQARAGAYKKGKVEIDGMRISIETPQGAERTGVDAQGKPWSVKMPVHYGYFLETKGRDKDHVDVYIGPNPTADTVYVVDQINPETKAFDEHKVLLGFETEAEALAAYDASFSDGRGPDRRGAVTTLTKAALKTWLTRGNTVDPLAYKPPTRKEVTSSERKKEGQEALTEEPGTAAVQSPEPSPVHVPAQAEPTPAAQRVPTPKPRVIRVEDVDVENRGTFQRSGRGSETSEVKQPAWFVPTTQDPRTLSKLLLTDATPSFSGRKGKGDAPRNSFTHRMTAILDRKTGKVHLVSTFQNNKQTRVTKFTDEVGPKLKRAKSLALTSVLGATMETGDARYQVIGSARTTQPTEYLHDEYPDLATFEREFQGPVERAQRAVQSTAAAMEAQLAQAAAVRPEITQAPEERIPSEVQEILDANQERLEQMSNEETGVGGGGEPTVDYQEPAMADRINLAPEQVSLLLNELPNFDSLDELAEFIESGQVSPDMLSVMQTVARQDPHFFGRVMASGIETVLKDYGYETQVNAVDARQAQPVEQAAAEPAQADIRPDESRGGQRTGGPSPAVESQQDSPREAEPAGSGVGPTPDRTGGAVESAATEAEQRPDLKATQTLRDFLEDEGLDADEIKEILSQPSYEAAVEKAADFLVEFTDEADAAARQIYGVTVGGKAAALVLPQQQMKRRQPAGPPADIPLDTHAGRVLRAILEAATKAGIDVRVVRGAIPAGAFSEQGRVLVQVIGETVGVEDVRTAFHEVAHDVFANEPEIVRERLLRAIDSLSDQALGIDLGADSRIRADDPAGLGQSVLQEERLVEATAARLQAEGFDPERAQGFAQRFVRFLKDLYLRAAMAVQRMLGLRESPALARQYFENRVKRLLAGDTTRMSYMEFFGLGTPSWGQRSAKWFESSRFTAEGMDGYGALDREHVPDTDLAASRFNLDRAMRFRLPTNDPQYNRTVEIEKRAAVINHLRDLLSEAAAALPANKELRRAIQQSEVSPEQFLRDILNLPDTEAMLKQLDDARNPDGTRVEFDREKRIDGFKGKANTDIVLAQAYRNTMGLLSKMGRAQQRANETIFTLTKRLERAKEKYEKARANYKDWQYQTTEVVREMRREAQRLFRSIAGLTRRQSVIEQQLKVLDPTAVLKDYAPVFEKLFTGDQLQGQKLFDLLDALANDPAVDFTKPVDRIKKAIEKGGLANIHPYEVLIGDSKEAKALLATVAAFAKTHQKIMAEIELRKLKDGARRAEIERSAEALAKDKQEFLGSLRELARTAKLEERYRNAHSEALREIRELGRRITKANIRLKVIDQISPVISVAQSDLGAKLQLAADATWRHGMPYNVPPSADAKSADVVTSVKKVQLDSTGVVTNPVEIEADLRKMAEFLAERERRYNDGDPDAKDSVYQAVRRQMREIIEHKNYSVRVGPAQRFMLELVVMPVGRRMADAFGTPAARMIDQMINKMTDVMNELRPEAERIGRRSVQLENELLELTPGIDRDYLRDNFLNPAKREMMNQHDLEEIYADQPNKLRRAIYGRVREMLLRNEATRPYVSGVIDQFMPRLEKLLEFQHKANQFLLERVVRADTGVRDPNLKVFNPATGKMEEGIRRHLQVGAYTFAQKLHKDFGVMVTALNNSDWASFREDVVPTLAEVYNEQGADAARAAVHAFFNNAEYGDQVRNRFFKALAEMDNESPFSAPAMEDAITEPPADTVKVREAFERAKGEPIAFAEELYELHGGTGDKGVYVQSVMQRLADIYQEVRSIQSQHDPTDRMVSVRGMTPDALIDARRIEHLPGSWFDYHSFDQRDMYKMIERIASQTAFGRGQERLAAAFETVANEVQTAHNRLTAATDEVRRKNPLANRKQIEKALEQKLGKQEYRKLRQQVRRARFIRDSVKELSDYFRRDNATDGTLRAMTRMAQSLGALLVNNPASAITQMAALLDINIRYGASTSTIGATFKTIRAVGKEIAASLAQAIGIQMRNSGEYERLFVDLGLSDPAAFKKLHDALDRLEGEGRVAQFFRGVNDVIGFGVTGRGVRRLLGLPEVTPEHTVLRPLQPFTTSTIAANRALTVGFWTFVGRYVMKGMEFYKANQDKFADPTHKLTADLLRLQAHEKDSFKRLVNDMERWGLNFEDMVRGALSRADKTLFTDQEALRLYSMMIAEVSSESSLSNMPLAAYNNSLIRFALPLLGWSFRRMQQVGSLRLNTEGQLEMRALYHGLMGLGVVALGGLALNMAIDEYYEQLLGKKRNLRPVFGAPDAGQLALGLLEQLNRVGSFGLFGELANTVVNVGGGGDNRMISVDQRVVALSAFQSLTRAISSWIHQGEADYVHVVRPMAQALGGGGLLQYMQIANKALGLDNAESRVTARMNAQNWLRVVGRMMEKDVRTFGGGLSAPTPISASLTRMELAAYANNAADFQAAYREAVRKAQESGVADPVDHVKRAFAGRNPLRSVFRTTPTNAEYRAILANLPDSGRRDVAEAVNLFNRYAELIGARPFEGRAERRPTTPAMGLRRLDLTAIRNRGVEAIFAQ